MERHPLGRQVYKIAKTYTDYTTTKLLTMEFVDGLYRLDRILDDLTPEEVWEVASAKVEGFPPEVPFQLMYAQAVLGTEAMTQWETAHGDLHLGNVYLIKPKEKGDSWRIFLCDFGMMIESPGEERDWLEEMFAAIMYYRSGDKLVQVFDRAGSLGDVTEAKVEQMQRLARFVVQTFAVPMEEGKEAVLHGKWQRGTPTNVMGAVMYQYAQMGVKWSDYWWLAFKNIDYLINMGATLSSTVNWSEAVLMPGRRWAKKETLKQLEGIDVTNLKDSVDQVLAPLRDYDREQVLNCLLTGQEVKPLERSWVHAWDLRFDTEPSE
jgi:hypothetical protein